MNNQNTSCFAAKKVGCLKISGNKFNKVIIN